MRKFVVAIAFLLGIIFIIGKLAEVQAVAETLRRGDWRFLLLALGVQAAWLLNVAVSYQAIYRAVGIEETVKKLVLLSSAAYFVNVVAPSAGMGGMAVFITAARRQGHSSARVTVAGVLYVLFDYLGFLCILSLGLFVLFRRNHLTSTEIIASAVLVAVALVLSILLLLGMRSAGALGQALAWMARQVNRILRPFIHREYLSEARAHEFAHEAAGGLLEVRRNHGNLLRPALLALTNKALLITVLFLVFLAFKIPFSAGTLVAGFSIGYLFFIVSPTPAGIGVVEGAMTLGLGSLNVPLGAAAVLALAYRGITFWAPMLAGMAAFRWLSRLSPRLSPRLSTRPVQASAVGEKASRHELTGG